MRLAILLALVIVAGCNGRGPTAPTPPPIVTIPPVVVAPPVVEPPSPPPFPPTDPRFDLAFYRMFVHDVFDHPGAPDILRRHSHAPRIYLRTVHANGQPIDTMTLDQTAAALESATGLLTGVFGLAGVERGTGTRAGQPGWITVSWNDDPARRSCGRAAFGGDWIDLFTNTAGCRCAGGPAIALVVVKHELGHALGFRHTDSRDDLMHSGGHSLCATVNPSAREMYHAAVAYTQPLGSLAP